MRIRIPGIFPRREPEAAPAEPVAEPAAPAPAQDVRRDVGESTASFSVPVTYMHSDIPEVDSAYGYGHLDGRRGVPPENFRAFVTHTVEGEGIDVLLPEVEAQLAGLREQAADLRRKREELAGLSAQCATLKERKAAAEEARRSAAAELKNAQTVAHENASAGSVVQGSIFLIAALFFILGDVVMSQKIVADALGLTGSDLLGWDESWYFAIGLAMISIVLKPAYDRLVETPFWHGRETRFAYVICILAVASLITLGVLGAFRSEANGILTQISMLGDGNGLSPAAEAARLQKLMELQRQQLESKLAWWSFVLSGVLFAAAGAVSLGIALRQFSAAWHQRWASAIQLRRRNRIHTRATEADDALDRELESSAAAIRRLETSISDQPSLDELTARANELAERRAGLLTRRTEVRTGRLLSLYDDGYEAGRLMESEGRSESTVSSGPSTRVGADLPRRRRPRPFVALRRAIREARLANHAAN